MDSDTIRLSVEELLEHTEWLQRLARGLTTDSGRADDLVQETWKTAALHPPCREGNARAWLAKILRNLARQYRRREKLRVDAEMLGSDPDRLSPSAEELVSRAELQRLLTDRVLGLSEPYRSTVLLRYFGGYTAVEIGRQQGVAANTVRSRLKRALDRLRQDLDSRFLGDRRAWVLIMAKLPEPEDGTSPDPSHSSPARERTSATHSHWPGSKLAGSVVLAVGVVGLLWWSLRSEHEAPLETQVSLGGEPAETVLDAFDEVPHPIPEDSQRELLHGSVLRESRPEDLDHRRIEVKVIDPDGQPVAGATVQLVYGRVSSPGGRRPRRTLGITRLDGQISIGIQEDWLGTPQGFEKFENRASLLALAPGRSASDLHHIECPSGIVQGHTIQVGGPDLTLRGRVLDSLGRPVAGALISIGDDVSWPVLLPDGEFVTSVALEATSAADGSFEISHLVTGRLMVSARARGFVSSVSWENASGRVHGCSIRLIPGASLQGVVLGPDGIPRPGARIWYDEHGQAVSRLVADAQGRYQLEGIKPGQRTLWAQDVEQQDLVASSVLVLEPGENLIWNPILRHRDGIRLRLTNEKQQPLAHFRLQFSLAEEASGWKRQAQTDAEGRVSVHDCPEGPVRVRIYAPEVSQFPVKTIADLRPSSIEREVTVNPSSTARGTIVGTVLDHEGGRFGQVDLRMKNLTTKLIAEMQADPETGGFRVDLPPGRYQIDALCGERGCLPLGTIEVETGKLIELGEIRAARPGLLRMVGIWPDRLAGARQGFALAAAELLDGKWMPVYLDQRNERPLPSYHVLPGCYSLVIERDGKVLHRQDVQVESGREARLEIGPGTLRHIPVRFETDGTHSQSTRLSVKVTRLQRTTFVPLEVVAEERLLAPRDGSDFESFFSLAAGTYQIDAETDTGLTGSVQLTFVGPEVVRARTIQLHRSAAAGPTGDEE